MRFFVAKSAPQNDGGFFGGVTIANALRAGERGRRGLLWKSGGKPPHSIMGSIVFAPWTLRDPG
jgi:hypothetical protein